MRRVSVHRAKYLHSTILVKYISKRRLLLVIREVLVQVVVNLFLSLCFSSSNSGLQRFIVAIFFNIAATFIVIRHFAHIIVNWDGILPMLLDLY